MRFKRGKWAIPTEVSPFWRTNVAFSSSVGNGETDNGIDFEEEEEEDDESSGSSCQKLETISYFNWSIQSLRDMEERGQLKLQPFYQRGYKWSQKQASLWVESIMSGFPCVPEIILLKQEDDEGETSYATFDGRQRLTSIINFIKDARGEHWKVTQAQKNIGTTKTFALQGLTILKDIENHSFKDLPKRHQNSILQYGVRCAVIPPTWKMREYLEFFRRIQGGGTPMSEHELRRAISMGPFTELLDELARKEDVQHAFSTCQLGEDKIQEFLLCYFALIRLDDISRYGKPTFSEQSLETMKKMNHEMKRWKDEQRIEKSKELLEPLLKAFGILVKLFEKDEIFRRPAPLIKNGKEKKPTSVLVSNNVNHYIFLSMLYCFSRQGVIMKQKDLLENKDHLRSKLMTMMQVDPLFTESMTKPGTLDRIKKTEDTIASVISTLDKFPKVPPISAQTRRDLLAQIGKSDVCPICGELLQGFNDHLHIDHITPRSKGGTNDLSNLQVTHKTCNLRKSNKIS